MGSKWELGKMDRTLIRMWQKSVGLNGKLAKWIGLSSRCGKKCGSKWELGKMDRASIRIWQKVWVLMGTWQKCEGLNRYYARVLM